MITAQTHLKESEPFIPYKALLIAISSVIYTLPLCLLYRHNERCYGKFTLRWPLSLVLMTLSLATVALSFIPGSTHSRYSSSLAFAGFPHTNEHLCDHVFITITLTDDLLSPRPG